MPSESVTPTSGSDHVESATAPAAAAQTSPAAKGTVNLNETFGSLSELRDKHPELYKKMMEGIAQNICSQMARNERHLRELQKQYREG